MTNKELISKTFAFEKIDRIPFAVLNGQMWICAKNHLTVAEFLDLPDTGAQLLADTYQEMGSSIMTAGCAAAWPMITAMGGTIDMNTIAAEIITRPLKEISDIEKYNAKEIIAAMREDHYYQRTLVQTKNLRRIVGDTCFIGGGFFGPFTIAAQLLGVDDFMVALFEDEEGYVNQVLDFANEICIAYAEDLIENGLDLVTIPEPVASGDLISPDMFDEYVLPIDLKMIERLKDKCDNILVHICGKTDHLVKVLAAAPVTVFSVDSIDMVQAQKDADGKMALFGNLNPANILAAKSAEEVYAYSKGLCEKMKPYGGFILAPGCDLAPNIPLENLQAMAKAAQES